MSRNGGWFTIKRQVGRDEVYRGKRPEAVLGEVWYGVDSASNTKKRYAYLDCVYGNRQLGVFVVLGHFSLDAMVS